MSQLRHWPALVAIVAIILSLVLWARLDDLSRRLDDTTDALAGVALQSAFVEQAISAFSGPLTDQLEGVVAELDTFSTSVIAIPIDIDQSLGIDTEITFARTIDVPIITTIPIEEVIDTTITIKGPLGVDIDVDVTVPVDVDVPVDLVVPIEIDEIIPVQMEVPLRLSFPLEFEVAGTPLADLAKALRQGLSELASAFG